MKSIWTSIPLGGLLICLALESQAAGDNGRRYIASVGVHDTGHVIVEFTEPGAHVLACTNPGYQKHVLLHRDDSRFKAMYALLLSAFHARAPVQGWVSGCVDLWGNGANQFPRMLTISLVQ